MTLDPETRDAAAIIETAQQAVREPTPIEPGVLYALPNPDGTFVIVDTEQYGDHPYAKRGSVALHEPASLVQYVEEHRTAGTSLFANIDGNSVTAILDGHEPRTDDLRGSPGWGTHRANLTLRHTPAWQRWVAKNNAPFSQHGFAEFVEESVADIREPEGATMLELAQTFEATKSVAFKSQTRLADGQRQLTYVESVDASGGATGQIQVPSEIVLGLAPYEGVDPYRITARFRFRLDGSGTLTIVYVLDRPEDVLRAAFGDVVGTIQAETGLVALRGAAPHALRS